MPIKKGFTLVELSIVLVIIGLLIGGILAAQSMISSAKINSFVNQIQKYDIIASNFREKFACLPGDTDKLNNPGNCDGIITDAYETDGQYNGEIAQYWRHIYAVNMLDDRKVTGQLVSSSLKLGVTFPEAKIGDKCGILIGTPDSGEEMLSKPIYSVLQHNLIPSTANFSSGPCMTADAAYSIDKKMDDGIAYTGNVIGGSQTTDLSAYGRTDAGDPKDCFIDTGTNFHPDYNMASAFINPCGLHIRLLSTTNQQD